MYIGIGIHRGRTKDRKNPTDTLVLIYIKNLHVLVFQTDGLTDNDINPVWASLTTFLQVNPV